MASLARSETPLTIKKALADMLRNQPRLDAAALQVQRSQLQTPVVRSQLGWIWKGQAGVSHDMGFTGVPSDRVDVGTGVQRKTQSGNSLELGANYSLEDSESPFIPTYPNPANTTKVDISYRTPLSQGSGNPDYQHDLISAEAGAAQASAQQQRLRDQLSGQLMDIFYSAAMTRARIKSAEAAIDRAERLKKFIEKNIYLGISEQKDRLQVDAQLHAQIAEAKGLLVIWEKQRTSLNRLMGQPWDSDVSPLVQELTEDSPESVKAIIDEVIRNSPDRVDTVARLQIAETVIARSRDKQKNQLDLVMSLGGRNVSGDSTLGAVDETDYAGKVQLEFRRTMDRKGVDAQLTQAQLDRSILLKQVQDIKMELEYTVKGLLSEIEASRIALADYEVRFQSEKKKYQEANNRYRTGRTDISELIRFENELQQAELAVELKHIELASKLAALELLRGTVWRDVMPIPPMTQEQADG